MSSKPLHIIQADDDPEDLAIFRECLNELDPSVHLVQLDDGHSLIAYLATLPHPLNYPCIIVSDMKMPLTDGMEVLKFIRSHPNWKHLPVAVLTTSSTDYDRNRTMKTGATAFFSKPDSYAGVFEMVKNIIRLAASKNETLN